jgi:hypothetical protein
LFKEQKGGSAMYPPSKLNSPIILPILASIDYDRLFWKARLGKVLGKLVRRQIHLLDLQDELDRVNISRRHYAGIQYIPIDRIRGSESKAQEFNPSFKPLLARNRQRWESVADAQANGVPLPPIKVVQMGEIYFVRDGHHRVSVANEFGMRFVEAEVIVWEIGTTLPMSKFPVKLDPAHQISGQCAHL